MKRVVKTLTLMLVLAIASLILHPFLWIGIVHSGWFDSETMLMMCAFLCIYIIVGGFVLYLCRNMSWQKQALSIFLSINVVMIIAVLLYCNFYINDGMTGFMFLTMGIVNVILSVIPISLGCYLINKSHSSQELTEIPNID